MTVGGMECGIDNSTVSLEPSVFVSQESAALALQQQEERIVAVGKVHSSGSTETLCPEILDGVEDLPVVSGRHEPASILSSKSDGQQHKGNRSRPHNVVFSDNRSEASSEHTKASKFKVVKLESKAPYFRGRWQCFDFHDRMKDTTSKAAPDKISSSTEQSSTATTIAAGVATTTITTTTTTASSSSVTVDIALPVEPVANPLAKPSKFKVTAVQLAPNTPAVASLLIEPPVILAKPTGDVRPQQMTVQAVQSSIVRHSQDSTDSSSFSSVSQQSVAQPRVSSSQLPILISDSNAALSAELSRRTTIDITAAGSQETAGLSLDNKIRQCMDLVGNHLIIAVREELGAVTEEMVKLKEKLDQLEFENSALRSENIILRTAAAVNSNADLLSRNQSSSRKK